MNMNDNVQIVRMLLIQTGTYNDMVRRSFTTSLDANLLNQISYATQQGLKTSAAALANVASQFVHPNTAGNVVMIPHGFDTNRFRFLMEVVSNRYQGGEIVQYICGYTDHYGISHGGHFDPHTRFYINSIVTTRRVMETTQMGAMYQQRVSSADHLQIGRAHV